MIGDWKTAIPYAPGKGAAKAKAEPAKPDWKNVIPYKGEIDRAKAAQGVGEAPVAATGVAAPVAGSAGRPVVDPGAYDPEGLPPNPAYRDPQLDLSGVGQGVSRLWDQLHSDPGQVVADALGRIPRIPADITSKGANMISATGDYIAGGVSRGIHKLGVGSDMTDAELEQRIAQAAGRDPIGELGKMYAQPEPTTPGEQLGDMAGKIAFMIAAPELAGMGRVGTLTTVGTVGGLDQGIADWHVAGGEKGGDKAFLALLNGFGIGAAGNIVPFGHLNQATGGKLGTALVNVAMFGGAAGTQTALNDLMLEHVTGKDLPVLRDAVDAGIFGALTGAMATAVAHVAVERAPQREQTSPGKVKLDDSFKVAEPESAAVDFNRGDDTPPEAMFPKGQAESRGEDMPPDAVFPKADQESALHERIAARVGKPVAEPPPATTPVVESKAASGKKYQYAPQYRPPSFDTMPKGFSIVSGKSEGKPFGVVEFDRPLTRNEIADFQLDPLDPLDPINVKKKNEALRQQVINNLSDNDTLAFVDRHTGRVAMLSPDPRKPGKFRITRFTEEGIPSGHDEYGDLQEAVKYAAYDFGGVANESSFKAKPNGENEAQSKSATTTKPVVESAPTVAETQAPAPKALPKGGAEKQPWEMTREEFDRYWVAKSKEGVASEVARNTAKDRVELERLRKMISDDPGNPAIGSIKEQSARIEARIAEEQKRLNAPVKKPSEFMDQAQYRWHQGIDAALKEGKPVPPEVLADYPDLAQNSPAPASEAPTVRDGGEPITKAPLLEPPASKGKGAKVEDVAPEPKAAKPESPTPKEGDVSIKNAKMAADLEALGLEPPEKRETISNEESVKRGTKIIEEDAHAGEKLVSSILEDPRSIDTDEGAVLLHERNRLRIELSDARDVQDVGRIEKAKSDLQRLAEAARVAGEKAGRSFQFRQAFMAEDYSYAGIEARLAEAKGDPIPEKGPERDFVNEVADEAAAAFKAEKQAADNAEKDRRISDLEETIKGLEERLKRPERQRKYKARAEVVRKEIDELFAELARETGSRAGANLPSGKQLEITTKILRKYVELGFNKLADVVTELGDRASVIKPHMEAAWEAAQAEHRASLAEKMKARVAAGEKMHTLGRYVDQITRRVVESGIKGREEVLDAVHAVLKEVDPKITRDETADAINGYGRWKQLSTDETSVTVRGIKGELRQLSKLRDIAKKIPPKKSGVEQAELTPEGQRLAKKVREEMKRQGIKVTDPETQLKTSLESSKTALRNRIRDLQHEIDTGERIVDGKTEAPTDAEKQALIKQRDALQAQHDAIFGDKSMSDAERAKASLKATEKSLAEYERMVAENDVARKGEKQGPPTEETARIEAQRRAVKARRDALKAQVEEMRSLIADPEIFPPDPPKPDPLDAKIAALEEKIAKGDTSTKPQKQGAPTEKQDRLAKLNERLAKMRAEERRTPETERQIAALQKRIERFKAGVESRRKATVDTAEVAALRNQLDALRAEKARARKAEKPDRKVTTEEERTLERLHNRQDDLLIRLDSGDLSPKKRGTATVDTEAVAKARAEVESLSKQIDEARKAANPPKSKEQRAIDAYLTRKANELARAQERLTYSDFIPREPKKPRELTPKEISAKADVERVLEKLRIGEEAYRRAHRTRGDVARETLVKWRRAFVLSSPSTLAKLTAAGVERMGFTPIEEAIGAGIGKAFPRLAERAPREGGISISAEAQALTHGFMQGIKDAAQTLKSGKSDLDLAYGDRKDVLPPTVLDFFGHLHGALKAPTKRNEFARSFAKRSRWALENGIDARDPVVQMRIAKEAYVDANRSIFMQDNRVVDAYKRALSALESKSKDTGKQSHVGKSGAAVARVLFPIVKVPTNVAAETFTYLFGGLTGGARLAHAYAKGIETLHPADADVIMRSLKKGSLGGAVLALGYIAADSIGGYYQPGKRDEDDVKFGSIKVFGVNVPSLLIHNPLLEVLQVGATMRRVADSMRKGEEKGLTNGALAAALGVIEQVPFARETVDVGKASENIKSGSGSDAVGGLVGDMVVPTGISWLARQIDTDRNGDPIKRKPHGFLETIKAGIPGLRSQVPTGEKKGYYR